MKFKPQRGSLADSMRDVVEVADVAALRAYLAQRGLCRDGDGVEITPYAYDSRINWDAHIVTVNGNGIGFTDGPAK